MEVPLTLQFLKSLSGGASGPYADWLETLDDNVNICWYPSAGRDFRDIGYLSDDYTAKHRPRFGRDRIPDVFLHTDYYPWSNARFLNKSYWHRDHATTVRCDELEELPPLDLPLDDGLIDFPKAHELTNRVFFAWLQLDASGLDEAQTVPFIYVFAENTAFAHNILLARQAKLSHLVHIRYGGGIFGGGKAAGGWLPFAAAQLGCPDYISDGRYMDWQRGDRHARKSYPGLFAEPSWSMGESFRDLPGIKWSNHGQVTWRRMAVGQD